MIGFNVQSNTNSGGKEGEGGSVNRGGGGGVCGGDGDVNYAAAWCPITVL